MANPNGNPENLRPVQTKEEAKKRGAAGGRKSGVVRRRKRDLQQASKWMFDAPAVTPLANNLSNIGIDEKDQTNLTGIIVGLAMKAARGDVAAFKGFYHPADSDDDDEEPDDVLIVLPDNGRGDGPKPVQSQRSDHVDGGDDGGQD